MPLTDNLRGALFMSASMAGFSVNDATIKLAATDLPLFQAIFLRGLMASTMIGLLAWRTGAFKAVATLQRRDSRLMGMRLVAELGGTFAFLTALVHMPLANATAILQVLPLVVTLGAALFLRERVRPSSYVAIAIGFVGVLMIVRPGSEGFDVYSIYALLSVLFVALRDLLTSRLSPLLPSLLVAFTTAVGITAVSGVIALIQTWKTVSIDALGLLAIAACGLMIGYLFSVKAMRAGDLSVISPFRYSVMLWALLLGVLLFDHWPGPLTLAGAAILAATGIYTVRQEGRARRARTAAAAAGPRGSESPPGTDATGRNP